MLSRSLRLVQIVIAIGLVVWPEGVPAHMQEESYLASHNSGQPRRHFVRPQPKSSETSDEPPRGRQRATTIGAARGTKADGTGGNDTPQMEEDTEATQFDYHDADDVRSESQQHSNPEIRVLKDVISGLLDEDAREVSTRLLGRVDENREQLTDVYYLLRSQQEQINEIRMGLGPRMKIFPPKGTTAAATRNVLSKAFFSNVFGKAVIYILVEYEVPFQFALAAAQCEKWVSDKCKELLPGCWPQTNMNTSTAPQDNQASDCRNRIQRAARNYAEHMKTEPYRFRIGFPLQRRALTEDGRLDDSDNWSICVVTNEQTEETKTLLQCKYFHDVFTQKFFCDERILEEIMGWTKDDMRFVVDGITRMYRSTLVWVGGSHTELMPLGKRRLQLQTKGKAPTDGKGKGPAHNYAQSFGIPSSFRQLGKDDAKGYKGDGYSKGGSPYGESGTYKGKFGDGGKSKQSYPYSGNSGKGVQFNGSQGTGQYGIGQQPLNNQVGNQMSGAGYGAPQGQFPPPPPPFIGGSGLPAGVDPMQLLGMLFQNPGAFRS